MKRLVYIYYSEYRISYSRVCYIGCQRQQKFVIVSNNYLASAIMFSRRGHNRFCASLNTKGYFVQVLFWQARTFLLSQWRCGLPDFPGVLVFCWESTNLNRLWWHITPERDTPFSAPLTLGGSGGFSPSSLSPFISLHHRAFLVKCVSPLITALLSLTRQVKHRRMYNV